MGYAPPLYFRVLLILLPLFDGAPFLALLSCSPNSSMLWGSSDVVLLLRLLPCFLVQLPAWLAGDIHVGFTTCWFKFLLFLAMIVSPIFIAFISKFCLVVTFYLHWGVCSYHCLLMMWVAMSVLLGDLNNSWAFCSDPILYVNQT